MADKNKRKRNKVLALAASVTFLALVVGVVFAITRPQRLEGEYTAKIYLLLTEREDTLSFERDIVIEKSDGETLNRGHYKIEDGKLKLIFNGREAVAKLSKSRDSFTLEGNEGLGDLFSNGLVYKKRAN